MKKIGNNPKKRKGAALVVAILLAAVIGSAAIGVTAIAFRQVNTAETYNNGLAAYYAAESGLEEGLLRNKYDKNAQIPESITSYFARDTLLRRPANAYRDFLGQPTKMRLTSSNSGVQIGYGLADRSQVYDLDVFWQQKYFGVDKNDNGFIDANDIASDTYNNPDYKIEKDDSKSFTILPADNNIYLYWKWIAPNCQPITPGGTNYTSRAVEIKIKDTTQNEHTALFRDAETLDHCATINNSTKAIKTNGAFTASSGVELKAAMGITAYTATELTIKPVGNTSGSGDGIYFGFNQAPQNNLAVATRTTGPSTTIQSTGYFAGNSRQITANIDRQTGTILDIFNYVIYKGQ
ncbi:MAG: pilus assembly PilX N-terminal domain-containing protein [Candidatus Berkelbacteria bacterium]